MLAKYFFNSGPLISAEIVVLDKDFATINEIGFDVVSTPCRLISHENKIVWLLYSFTIIDYFFAFELSLVLDVNES